MIEINHPEIEALIQQRLVDGGFKDVEAVLEQALTDAPLPAKSCSSKPPRTGAELLAALVTSPFKEVNLEPERYVSAISDPVKF